MTLIAIEGRKFRSGLHFLHALAAVRLGFGESYRRWRKYRTVIAELRQYSDGELVELGIGPYDIENVAQAGTANDRQKRRRS